MTENTQKIQTYNSLQDISTRKEEILKAIQKDQKDMGKLWNEIFHPAHKKQKKKRGLNLQELMNTGIGVIDGALFAWKLYRKFKR